MRCARACGRAVAAGDPGARARLRRAEEPRQPHRRRDAARARDRHRRARRHHAVRHHAHRRVQRRRRPGPRRAAAARVRHPRALATSPATRASRRSATRTGRKLSVTVCSRALINVAAGLQKRWGMPNVEVSFFGATEIARSLRAIADALEAASPEAPRPACASGSSRSSHDARRGLPRRSRTLRGPARTARRALLRRREELVDGVGALGSRASRSSPSAPRSRPSRTRRRSGGARRRCPAHRGHLTGRHPPLLRRGGRDAARRRRSQPLPRREGGLAVRRREPGARDGVRRLRGAREPRARPGGKRPLLRAAEASTCRAPRLSPSRPFAPRSAPARSTRSRTLRRSEPRSRCRAWTARFRCSTPRRAARSWARCWRFGTSTTPSHWAPPSSSPKTSSWAATRRRATTLRALDAASHPDVIALVSGGLAEVKGDDVDALVRDARPRARRARFSPCTRRTTPAASRTATSRPCARCSRSPRSPHPAGHARPLARHRARGPHLSPGRRARAARHRRGVRARSRSSCRTSRRSMAAAQGSRRWRAAA